MRKSPELQAVAEQAMHDQMTRGVEATLEITSREPGFLNIGTAPGEWFSSFAEFEQAARAAGASGGIPPFENQQIDAYEEGTVGWGSVRGDLKLPSGATVQIRQTFIVHQEGGGWKVVQSHSSVAIPDEQLMNIR